MKTWARPKPLLTVPERSMLAGHALPYEDAFARLNLLDKHWRRCCVMSDDNEERKDDQGENVEENMSLEDMQAFVEGLNHFVHEVSSMDWPEEFQLDNDQKFCFSVFRTYWRQRHRGRGRREQERRFHMRFEGADADDIRRFMQERFGRMFGLEDATLNIDPEDHQPDEEHVDEVAKDRQRRFQDEWE